MASQHTEPAPHHTPHDENPAYEAHLHHPNYVKVWGVLVVLLAISVAGPLLGHPLVTLVTAFGIAVVKAYLVAKNFMHITVAPRFVAYLVGTCLVFMLLFFAGTSPDVMKLAGRNWAKPSLEATNLTVERERATVHGEGLP
jgi:caa(3)-type oxidase subunit IV